MPSLTSNTGVERDPSSKVEELERELAKARQREAVTAEIIRVIGSSPTNVRPVFDTVVRRALTVCDGLFSALLEYDGEFLRQVAQHNYTAKALEMLGRLFPA